MIKELSIDYDGLFPGKFSYISKGRFLPERTEFSEGLNLVIGENGSGKSTLLNVVKAMTLAGGLNVDVSMWDQAGMFYPKAKDFLSPDYGVRQTAFSVVNDYDAPVMVMNKLEERRSYNGGYDRMEDFVQHWNEKSMSKGQKMMNAISESIDRANRYMSSYSIDSLFPRSPMNDVYREAIDKVKEYVMGITANDLPKRGVFLMDEPDEGLDINNLKILKNFLVSAGDSVQVIAVVHNPLLIRSLSDKANVIELTPGYLEDIKGF